MVTIESRGPGAPGIASKALIALAAIGAVMFIAIAALPYRALLGSEASAKQSLEAFQFSYWPVRVWLLTHIAGGILAILTGPVQLWLGLHNVKMETHRKLGYVYIFGMAIGSVGAIGLAFQTQGGPVFGSGLFFLAIAWITTTSMAFVAIKKGLTDQHKEWTIRSYVVTFAFVTFRAFELPLEKSGMPQLQAIGIMAWACWAVPLLVTEAVLQARSMLKVRS